MAGSSRHAKVQPEIPYKRSIGYAYGIDHGTASMEKTWPA
jgi:hypothetical protein